ncbi:4Fe-4S binding protein [Cellulosilyticum sp. I15G10I2]|uniref:4Fe-4S binding protein n=1 Tax=Cellulosilyticum sp. I15G10I2 TaxID=1892843 RepID=UPI001495AFF1|nr:4Fe-4S binding protein [Cellulosilyticum sp. I15G10I2]
MAKRLRYDMNACLGCHTCSLVCSALSGYHSLGASAINIKTKGGLQGKFVCVVCSGCTENISCMEACKTGALKARTGGGVVLDKSKCIGCKECISSCTTRAIHYSDNLDHPIICRQCGTCTKYCPHNCLYLEEVE